MSASLSASAGDVVGAGGTSGARDVVGAAVVRGFTTTSTSAISMSTTATCLPDSFS